VDLESARLAGLTDAQQERERLVVVVQADGEDHAGFGDTVVRWRLSDDGVAKDLLDLADARRPAVRVDDGSLVEVRGRRVGRVVNGAQTQQVVELLRETLVSFR